MRKMTWRSGSCLVQLPPSSSKCVVYQVKNTIIVSFKSWFISSHRQLYPKSGKQEKNTSGIHGDVLFQVQSLCGSWGNNSNVDYTIYKYKFRVLQSNLIILFASHTWSCYKSVFQSIQHRGGSVSILAFWRLFTVKWRILVQHKCCIICYK